MSIKLLSTATILALIAVIVGMIYFDILSIFGVLIAIIVYYTFGLLAEYVVEFIK